MQFQTGSQDESQFTGDFGFLSATNSTNTSNPKPSMNLNSNLSSSKIPEVNMADFQDWNSRPASSTINSNQKAFDVDWTSFPSSNTSVNQAIQMDFTKNNSFNNSTNPTNFGQPNLNSSAKNPFSSPSQFNNQNFNQQSINKGLMNSSNTINSNNTTDPFQNFNQFGFGSQSQNIQKNPQPNIQSHNQNQSQWNQQNQQKILSHQNQSGGYSQHLYKVQNPHNATNSNLNMSSHQKNYSQNYNPQSFNQSQNSQESGFGKNDYQQNSNQIASNISNNTINETQQEKVQPETKTSITGNNPLRYIQPTGMGSIRGKR